MRRGATAAAARQAAAAARRALASRAAPPAEAWPVVIAGGGPTGLTTSMLLSRYGVPSLLLEGAPQLTRHPKAHFINHRTMEVFRGMGELSRSVERAMPPLDQWRSFVYCAGLTGDIIGRVDHFKGQSSPYVPDASPEPVAHLAQHRLLPMMAAAAAACPGAAMRMGHHVVGVRRAGADLEVEVEGPAGERYRLDAQYLVAADGAHSGIRQQLGVPLEGPGPMQHLINIHFTSPELGRLLRGREAMLYFIFSADIIAVMVAHDVTAGTFVAQVPYFPPLQSADRFTPEKCAELVRLAAGVPQLPLTIETIRPWVMGARVARSYQAGRVLLCGDAAHIVPPSGAFGMNTGVQDAHNLAWKLAAVVNGTARQGLLSSYNAERRPVGIANMDLSVRNFYEALRVPRTMGLDFQTANLVADVLSSRALDAIVPSNLRAGVLDAAITAGRAGSAVLRALRRPALEEIFASGETLRLQYPKEDLGFVYGGSGAAVIAEEPDLKLLAKYSAPKSRDDPYQPTTLPGARLPHVRLRLLHQGSLDLESAPRPLSTIDLPAALIDPGGLLLLLGPGPQLSSWLAAASEAGATTGVPLHPVVLLSGEQCRAAAAAADLPGGPTVVADEAGTWQELLADSGAAPGGPLLVRPDGHVAWRAPRGAAAEQPAAALALVVRRLYHLH